MPKARGKADRLIKLRKAISIEKQEDRAMKLHFLEIGPRVKMTRKQIESAYDAAVKLIDLSCNYEIFGKSAEEAEDAFGQLIDALQAD